jgi:Tfp pilus assembly protein PilO
MPPVKLSDREKKLAAITLVVAIFYVFYQFLLTPKWNEITKLNSKLQDARLELNVAEGKVKILKSIEKGETKVPTAFEVPVEERALAVLRAIAQATTKSGLNLLSIRPIMNEDENKFKFDLVSMGSYQDLYEFLNILRDLEIMVIIDSLRMSGGGVKRPDLSIKMVLTAYF